MAEVVGPDDPARDYHQKRIDYAGAGVSEYWIVDPMSDTITVLTLEEGGYVEHGAFGRGETAASAVLGGFRLAVSDVFDAPTASA